MSPRFWEWFHGVMVIVWAVMMPLAIFTGWIYAIGFVSVISIYANFVGHFGSWQASRAERREAESDD